MLRAFLDDATLADANVQLEALGYRTHEFGDSALVERRDLAVLDAAQVCDRREDRVATAA